MQARLPRVQLVSLLKRGTSIDFSKLDVRLNWLHISWVGVNEMGQFNQSALIVSMV